MCARRAGAGPADGRLRVLNGALCEERCAGVLRTLRRVVCLCSCLRAAVARVLLDILMQLQLITGGGPGASILSLRWGSSAAGCVRGR